MLKILSKENKPLNPLLVEEIVELDRCTIEKRLPAIRTNNWLCKNQLEFVHRHRKLCIKIVFASVYD